MKRIIVSISLFLLVGINAYSQEPSPPLTQGQPRKVHTESSARGNIEPKNSNNNAQKPMPTANQKKEPSKTNGSTKHRYEKNGDRGARGESSITNYTLFLMIFTGVLALASILQFFTTLFQLSRLRQTVEATKEAADAAKKSVDTIPTIERAYVYASSISANFESWRNAKPNQCSPISITARNYGKTPAKLVGITTKIQIEETKRGTGLKLRVSRGA